MLLLFLVTLPVVIHPLGFFSWLLRVRTITTPIGRFLFQFIVWLRRLGEA
jgi:hypothetical protein